MLKVAQPFDHILIPIEAQINISEVQFNKSEVQFNIYSMTVASYDSSNGLLRAQ